MITKPEAQRLILIGNIQPTENFVTLCAQVESGLRSDAVSPKGAVGVMQLMPATARELGVVDPMRAEQNVDGGVRYLKGLLRRYDGKLELALAAYNAGPGAVDRKQCAHRFRWMIREAHHDTAFR